MGPAWATDRRLAIAQFLADVVQLLILMLE